MSQIVRHLFTLFIHLGGFGLLIMGVLDSSVLFLPLSNDLLVIAMSARSHAKMPFYAAMATAGSVLGCLVLDWIAREGGEKGLEKHVPPSRLEYVKKKVKKRAAGALVFAALMPPPFPFTPFVAAAAALEYPRKRLLSVIAAARFARFSIDGVLAIFVGRRILQWAKTPALEYGVIALIVISVAGSVFSIYHWIQRSKSAGA